MSIDEKVNVGVIGVGRFGELHARVYSQLANVNLVGVCDADSARVEEVAGILGVRAFASTEDLLADASIQAVGICTSDQHHLEPTLAACAAGKHILLEKPMALEVSECDQMLAASKKAGIRLMVGHILRFDQRYVSAHEIIAAGEIGKVRHFFGRRNNPRSVARRLGSRSGYHTMIFHNAVHDIDIMNWFADDQVAEAYAIYQAGEMEAEGYSVSDTVLSLLKFQNGAAAMLENCWIYPDTYPTSIDSLTEVTGTHGRIVLDFSNMSARSFTQSGVDFIDKPFYWIEASGRVVGDLRIEIETFIRCVLEDLPVPVTGEDGRRAVATAVAIVASLETGQPQAVKL